MLEVTKYYTTAQDGLAIAHRNPGEVRPDIIEYLWERLNRSATELNRLEREHEELLEIDLPHLVVKFKHSQKEEPRWAFQSF